MGERAFKNGEVLKLPYKIVDYLGSGGMGEVYLATNVNLKDSRFAVKTLLKDAATSDNVDRFVGEAQVLARLRHPNIVQAFDFGKTPMGQPFLLMEFVEGTDLAAEMKRGPMAPDDAAHILGQLSGALAAMHSKGIFHRDVKPQNIFLIDCGPGLPRSAKLLDFGIATDLQVPGVTRAGQTVGTVIYMAPERFGSEAKAGQHTDQYALATIAYELLSGQKAFGGETQKVIDTKKAGTLPSSLPNAMHNTLRVIQRGMAADPSKRYPSVTAFHRDLVDAINADASTKDQPALPPPATVKEPLGAPINRALGDPQARETITLCSLQPTEPIPTDASIVVPATVDLSTGPVDSLPIEAIKTEPLVPTVVLSTDAAAGPARQPETAVLPVEAIPKHPRPSEFDRARVASRASSIEGHGTPPKAPAPPLDRKQSRSVRAQPAAAQPDGAQAGRPRRALVAVGLLGCAALLLLAPIVTHRIATRQSPPGPAPIRKAPPETQIDTAIGTFDEAPWVAPEAIVRPNAIAPVQARTVQPDGKEQPAARSVKPPSGSRPPPGHKTPIKKPRSADTPAYPSLYNRGKGP